MNRLLVKLSLAVGVAVVMLAGGSAAAAEAGSQLPPPGTKGIVSHQTGSEVFTSPQSNAYLYVPVTSAGSATTVTVSEIANQYGNGKLSVFRVFYLGADDGQCHSLSTDLVYNGGTAGFSSNQSLTVPASYTRTGNTAVRKLSDGRGTNYAVFCVVVTTNSVLRDSAGCQVRGSDGRQYRTCFWDVTFRLSTPPATGGLLGVYPGVGGDDNGVDAPLRKGTGYYLGWPFHVWSQEIAFATPCDVRNGAEPITLYDLDIPYSQANLYIQLQERSRGSTGAWTNVALRSGRSGSPGLRTSPSNGEAAPLANGASGATWYILPADSYGGAFRADREYKLTLSNIGQSNKIRVRIPYDQIYASVACADQTVTGTVYNAYHHATRYNGITIDTCVPGVSATTDANGEFSFELPAGTAYCVRLAESTLPSGAVTGGQRVRPWRSVASGSADNYDGCAAYAVLTNPMGYCSGAGSGSYECQIAAADAGVQPGCGSPRDLDRASDTGFDFVVRFRPVLSCTLTTGSLIEAGSSYPPQVTVRNDGISARPVITAGTVTVTVGTTTRIWTYATDTTTGQLPTSTSRSSTAADLAAVTLTDAGSYAVAATATATGDGLSVDPTPVDCGHYDQLAGQMPYLKEFGGDVWTGGNFTYIDPACMAPATSPGNAFGFAQPAGAPANGGAPYRGMSTQLTLTALMNINGVYSASNRDVHSQIPMHSAAGIDTLIPAHTYGPKGLTFANIGGIGPASTFGGGFGEDGPSGHCITNYFDDTRDHTITQPGDFTPSAIPSGRRQYHLTGSRTLPAITVPIGAQTAVFVDGDVYIGGNITLAEGAASLEQMPYFALIVRGDIHIAPVVTRLDGLYIAQPHANGTRGTIYSCSRNDSGTYRAYGVSSDPTLDILAQCNRQLAINGSVVANRIKWLRIHESLRHSTSGEAPDFATGAGTKAAEVINYTPQMWLAPSPLRVPAEPEGGALLRPYDAIRAMPPVY